MLKRSQTVGLITVFVATISFSFVLAKFARDSTGKDVLGATAACSCGFRGSFLVRMDLYGFSVFYTLPRSEERR